jgi:hypothetical protein
MPARLFQTLCRLATCAAVPASGGTAEACAGIITVQEALRAEQARYDAQTGNDFAAMERLFGDELVYVHSSTTLDTKASFIESMRSGAVRYHRMTLGDAKVRTYGCIAIITGAAKFEVTARGQDLKLDLLFHSV